MALKIRLSRGGAKKRPFFRIVVADVRSPRDGRFIEKLGTFNPLLPKDHAERILIDEDRIKHWLGHGALPTDRVSRFLDAAGIMKREARNNPQKAQPGKKRVEREEAEKAAKEEAEKKAAETAAAPPPEAPPAEETPAEDAPAEAPAEAAAAEAAPAEAVVEAPAEEAAPEAPAGDAPAAEEKPAEEAGEDGGKEGDEDNKEKAAS